ncbi:helix-turn-helix domain-containing protein [Roseomonas terrae]|jgi:DNA-binding IclR family transcriptional regulator|uniref:Helix-turn-helix domain-containing protein n=1 Tax=Neoroseomonas terrae TaxID=424799 RepID=A0ABS5EHH1_9PROT|nr:helix-turn-helix domain-containing protein [Neoroseomonas terrae]MBR0650097.1 helix-turn-helix domain-containing protein [Neoroseomonas terrae]
MSDDRVIKSVGRTLDLLEYFDEVRRPVSVTEVARALGMPQSSSSALLRSMVARGYCEADMTARRYSPTSRVTLLGSWIEAPLFEDGAVLRVLNEVHDATGELVLLGALSGLKVRHIYSLAARQPGRPKTRRGTIRPLGRSGMGNLFLATFPDRQIARLVHRINAEERSIAYHIHLQTLMEEIAAIRRQGYAVALDKMEAGIGGVNVLLPSLGRMGATAVAVSTLSEIVAERHAALFALIRAAVRRNLQQDLPRIGP